MPKFPTYRGELPECLNPLNPRHYLLLIYWIFFRPTALKYYLYQADPELYRFDQGKSIYNTRYVLAYRNLYIIGFIVTMMLSLLIGLPFKFLNSWILNVPVDLLVWMGRLVFGVVLGIAGGMITCIIFSMAVSTAAVGVFGIVISIPLGVISGLIFVTVNSIIDLLLFSLVSIMIVSITLRLSVAADKTMYRMIVGVVLIIVIGMAIILIGRTLVDIIIGDYVTILVIGITTGTLFIVTIAGMGYLTSGVIGGIAIGIVVSLTFSVLVGVMVSVGALRIIFYPFQLILALCSFSRWVRHPLEWDELAILPLPRTQSILLHQLCQNERTGLCLLAEVGSNSFQRWALQAALYQYIHKHNVPLHFLYSVFRNPDLNQYVMTPLKARHWRQNISVRHLFLGELALFFVETAKGSASTVGDRFVWWVTYILREHRHTPLTRFARMLYDLQEKEVVEAEEFNLSSYSEIYNDLSAYPGGKEIAQTFGTIATFLSCNELPALSGAHEITSNLITFENPIRPTVLTALSRLGEAGAEIATYRDSTSRANQMAALARATDALKDLDAYVQAEVMAPEQYLLRRIIRQWQQLIIGAGGELGRAEITGPVANPYVAGNPVTGELFVGREDILRRLEELWRGTGQKPSVVLYGHRRMGKSSILHNLGARFGTDTVIVNFNMQLIGSVANTGELLYSLALALYDEIGKTSNNSISEPDEEAFTAHNPYTNFRHFLKQLDQVREKRQFIITVDEFELIEEMINRGELEAQLLDFWRGLIQNYPWFVMAFAGLHTLQEMTRDYWHPLFGSVTGIPVSFLKKGAARKLITQPTADFDLDYDTDAIECIIALTHGQPYLVQLICHCLVTRFNWQSFEEGVERERRFSLADVEAVINAPEFYRDGDAYFTGVWRQAGTGESTGQQEVLRALAQSEPGMSAEELAQQSGLTLEDVQRALKVLSRHDVVSESEGCWQFTVELMRRWVVGIEHG